MVLVFLSLMNYLIVSTSLAQICRRPLFRRGGARFTLSRNFMFETSPHVLTRTCTQDSYTIYAASVLAANSILRSLFGAAFPLCASDLGSSPKHGSARLI